MSKKRRAKALKTANTLVSKKAQLDQSWEQLKQRHASWPKFGGKYGTVLQQVPKSQPRNQLQGTTTGRVSSRDWHIVELDRSPGLDDRVRVVQGANFLAQAMAAEKSHQSVLQQLEVVEKLGFIQRVGPDSFMVRQPTGKTWAGMESVYQLLQAGAKQVFLDTEMDLSKIEARIAASAFDYCRDGEAKAAFIERFGQEEWEKREAEAGAVKHTVLPMHKSNYMLVTDPEMIPLMVSKPGSKT